MAYQVDRNNSLAEAHTRITAVRDEETYFLDVIHYFSSKLAFLNMLEQALNPNEIQAREGDDYEFY
jgi:hypothetical protein